MSKEINDIADSLMEETLTEVAGNFFGTRKNLEESIESFGDKIKTLKSMEAEVLKRAGDLHYLLLEGQAAEQFYQTLRINPHPFMDEVKPSERTGRISKPVAIRTAGRYAEMVHRAYANLYEASHTYMHGGYITDKMGRKRLTLNYIRVRNLCCELNKLIEKVNREVSPSETLAFVSRLDPIGLEKAKITGGGVTYDGSLDKELAFKPLDCENIDLIAMPDLPEPEAVKSRLKDFCKSLTHEHKERVKELMDSI